MRSRGSAKESQDGGLLLTEVHASAALVTQKPFVSQRAWFLCHTGGHQPDRSHAVLEFAFADRKIDQEMLLLRLHVGSLNGQRTRCCPSVLAGRIERLSASRSRALEIRSQHMGMSRFADGGLDGNRPSLRLLQVGKRSALRFTSLGSHLHAIGDLLRAR